MVVFITVIHVLVSFFLILVVLLQSGKAADLAGAFGGFGSQTVFGPRGSATVLTRATTISAVIFMATSLTLAVLSSGSPTAPAGGDILDSVSAPAGQAAPASPSSPGTIQVEVGGKTQTLPIPGQAPGQEPVKK